MSMTDPLQALVSLQAEIRKGMPTHPTENYPPVRFVVDEKSGQARYTYARIEHGRVKAMAMFVSVDQIEGEGCFQVGYAVPKSYRGRGWAVEILQQGLDELSKGLGMLRSTCRTAAASRNFLGTHRYLPKNDRCFVY